MRLLSKYLIGINKCCTEQKRKVLISSRDFKPMFSYVSLFNSFFLNLDFLKWKKKKNFKSCDYTCLSVKCAYFVLLTLSTQFHFIFSASWNFCILGIVSIFICLSIMPQEETLGSSAFGSCLSNKLNLPDSWLIFVKCRTQEIEAEHVNKHFHQLQITTSHADMFSERSWGPWFSTIFNWARRLQSLFVFLFF